MATFSGTVYSHALKMDTALSVILPQDFASRESQKNAGAPRTFKTLILLHGLFDNYSAWLTKTNILRYAMRHSCAVIMPDAQRSFYTDYKYGQGYFSYVSDELPQLASDMFRLDISRENLMIAGLSMGGYGAMKCALTHPERYFAAGCFSGAVHIREVVQFAGMGDEMSMLGDFRAIFGETLEIPPKDDVFDLADRANLDGLRLYMTCGDADNLLSANERLVKKLKARGADVTFKQKHGGHEWPLWDESISEMLDLFVEK